MKRSDAFSIEREIIGGLFSTPLRPGGLILRHRYIDSQLVTSLSAIKANKELGQRRAYLEGRLKTPA